MRALRTLRHLDRLYYGPGHRSALFALSSLLSGRMPGAFLDRYKRGEFDDDLMRIQAREGRI